MSQIGQYISINQGVETLTGNVGGAVGPSNGNINLIGAGGVTVSGNPANHTLTITGSGAGITAVNGTANEITANTVAGVVTLSTPVTFIAPGSIQATTTSSGVTLATTTATNNLSINGNTITAGGSNATVDVSLVAKSTGNIDFTTETGGALVFRGLTAGFVVSTWHTLQASVQTANATPTVIASVVVNDSEMVSIKAVINGFQSDFTDCVGGEIMVTAYRPAGGDVTLVGAPIINVNYTDVVDTSDIAADVDVGTETIRLLVVGVAAQTWNWVTTYSYMYTIDNS